MTDTAMRLDPTLRVGSKGEPVRRLQQALNRNVAGLNLRTDGEYDRATADSIERFQDINWLVISGDADLCTQNALFNAETYEPIRHVRPFIPQPDLTSCWAACTAMLKRSSVSLVRVTTPPHLVDPEDGSLMNVTNREDWRPETESFAAFHNLRFRGPRTWTTQEFSDMLVHGPIMVDSLRDVGEYGANRKSPGHMTLVVGCRGDGQASGRGTTLMVYDPWPEKYGRQWRVNYDEWVSDVCTRTYRIFY